MTIGKSVVSAFCVLGITCVSLAQQTEKYVPPSAEQMRLSELYYSQRSCGIRAVYFVAAWMGKDVRLEEIRERMPLGADGTSLLEVKSTLEEMGIASKGVRLGAEELFQLGQEAVLYTKREDGLGHFVVFVPPDRIVDPPGQARIKKEDMDSMGWTGLALLIEPLDSPADKPKTDGIIVVDHPVVDLGALDKPATVSHTFKLTNTGDLPVDIEHIRPSCACSKFGSNKTHFAPGEQGELLIELSATKPGVFTGTLIIETNSTTLPLLNVKLTGRVASNLSVLPGNLVFSEVTNDSLPQKKTCTLISKVAGQEPTIEAIKTSLSCLDCLQGPGNTLEVTLNHVPDEESVGGVITVRSRLGNVEIPVTIHLAKPLQIQPVSLVFRQDSSTPLTMTVLVVDPHGKSPNAADLILEYDATFLVVTGPSLGPEPNTFEFSVSRTAQLKPGDRTEIAVTVEGMPYRAQAVVLALE